MPVEADSAASQLQTPVEVPGRAAVSERHCALAATAAAGDAGGGGQAHGAGAMGRH